MFDLLSWDKDNKVNSAFGYRPASATNGKGSTNHKGIDLSSYNDNVPSVLDGTVIANAWNNARGWYVTIRNKDGYSATYQHLASQSPYAVGTSVKEGQTIGAQGNTGASTGKHLHFEVKSASGLYVNPVDYLSGKLTGDTNKTTATFTDAHGRPVSNAQGTGGADNIDLSGVSGNLESSALGILGKVVSFLAVILLVILAVVLFMKAFNISII